MPVCTPRRAAALVLFAASSLLGSSSANAALLLSEPFDYASPTLSGQTGGTGWNGAWTAEVVSEVTLSNDGVSLNRADQLPSSGSRIADTDGATFTRVLAAGSQVDLNASGNTRYFSMLVR